MARRATENVLSDRAIAWIVCLIIAAVVIANL
jgi:hypothetical protein